MVNRSEIELDDELAQLESILVTVLSGKVHSEAHLNEQILRFQPLAAPSATAEDIEALIRRLTQRLSIDVEQGVALTSDDFEPWLRDKKRSMEWRRWRNYKQWMLQDGRPPRVIDKMDELTDEILDFAGDPTVPGVWKRRGLVIGEVQSGKTSTYLGLFNKAADAGYRLVIVLAGNTESLRQQTQERIDEGFIGRDSSLNSGNPAVTKRQRLIGVGALDQSLSHTVGMTTVLQDFRKSSLLATNISLNAEAAHPYVFVVKKNKSVLGALTQWLSEQPKAGARLTMPLLLLDDESDYASVNTKDENNPTAINGAIRGILDLFTRSSYVAFTATPFANIFIDHDVENDLFPRDFIYGLESPSNYVGSEKTFGTPDEPSGTTIDLLDVDDFVHLGHRASHVVGPLPESLLDALRAFFVVNAIRDLRGQDRQARSMLVNVSRYKSVQRQVFDAIEREASRLRSVIELHAMAYAAGVDNSDMAALHRSFLRHFEGSGAEWPEVLDALPAAVSDVRVQLFNSDTDKQLEDDGSRWNRAPRMIAVGGDVLSRGLTLSGLTISYFYRRVSASDTLLQMARWFGYRDGYEDLCRVWIDSSSAADYRFVAESTDELKRSLRLMLRQRLTPEHFGLAVRKHPGALLVTARNKMKAADVQARNISLIGQRVETTKLSSHEDDIVANYELLESLGRSLGEISDAGLTARKYARWSKVSKAVVARFLGEYRPFSGDAIFSMPVLSDFVRSSRAFAEWDVMIVNGERLGAPRPLGGQEFFPVRRTLSWGGQKELRVGGNSSRLAGPDDIKQLLASDVQKSAETAADARRNESGKKTVPETVYYPFLDRPALVLYPILPKENHVISLPGGCLLVAVKLALPGEAGDVRNTSGDVKYIINTVAQQNWLVEMSGEFGDDADE